jgi:hypothetical protein
MLGVPSYGKCISIGLVRMESYKIVPKNRYPIDFRRRVLAAFPDDRVIASQLEAFDMALGRTLLDNADLSSWSPDYVIANIESAAIEDLYMEALHAKEVAKLYEEWSKITNLGAKIFAPG